MCFFSKKAMCTEGTWRITPLTKKLVTPIYKPLRPFVRETTPFRGLTKNVYKPLTNWDDPPSRPPETNIIHLKIDPWSFGNHHFQVPAISFQWCNGCKWMQFCFFFSLTTCKLMVNGKVFTRFCGCIATGPTSQLYEI